MSNIYSDPGMFGLEVVAEVEWSDGCYQFDTTVAWRDIESGVIYLGHDSGCSCPVPFESIGRTDLTPVRRLQDAIDYLDAKKREDYRYPTDEWSTDTRARIDAAIGEALAKIGAAR